MEDSVVEGVDGSTAKMWHITIVWETIQRTNTRGGDDDDEGRKIIGYVYMKILIVLWTVCKKLL